MSTITSTEPVTVVSAASVVVAVVLLPDAPQPASSTATSPAKIRYFMSAPSPVRA